MVLLDGGFGDTGKKLTDELILCLMTDRSARYDAWVKRSEAMTGLDAGCAAVGDAELRCVEGDQDVQDSRCFGQMVMLERRMERANC